MKMTENQKFLIKPIHVEMKRNEKVKGEVINIKGVQNSEEEMSESVNTNQYLTQKEFEERNFPKMAHF